MFDLRQYQHTLVANTVEHMNQGGAPCLVSPTGSGKTVMMAEIARLYRSWGYEVVLAAHRNEIIKQIAASCRRHCGEPVGFYAAKHVTEDRGIMVTMMPTLSRRRSAISTFRGRVLLLDEAHHIQARTYQEVIREMRPAFFGGATATPVTPTGAGLGKFGITKLIIGPQPAELMADGSLCGYKLYGGDDAIVDTSGIKQQSGDFKKDELEERVLSVQGDFLRDLLRFNADLRPTITVTVSLAHAHAIAKEYSSRGISAEVVIGSTSQRDRDSAFERFTAGDLKVIVSVALIDEGLDLPAATCLQLIRPTRSLRLWKQLIGRVLRPDPASPGKVSIIIDHGNCWQHLPMPHDPINWTLEGKVKISTRILALNADNEVVEAPSKQQAAIMARGNSGRLSEIKAYTPYEQQIRTRVKAANKNLYLVEHKNFSPAILWPWANNPEGLNNGQRRRVERALSLPFGHCGSDCAPVEKHATNC